MHFVSKFIRNYPMTTLVIVAIWILCLIPIPETPLSHVTFIDKWTHVIMYLALSLLIGYERWHCHAPLTIRQQALYIFLMPSLMGALLEILQATCTNGMRSGEWLDFVADASGSAIAFFICILLARCLSKA